MTLPIAVGSMFTECNHLGGKPTELADFVRQELLTGADMLARANGTVAGILRVLKESQQPIVPLIVASTCPGGPLKRVCYETLKGELLLRLQKSLPAAGVLLAT